MRDWFADIAAARRLVSKTGVPSVLDVPAASKPQRFTISVGLPPGTPVQAVGVPTCDPSKPAEIRHPREAGTPGTPGTPQIEASSLGAALACPIGTIVAGNSELRVGWIGAMFWDAEDWRAFFDERAGIAEYDGGLPRADAEVRAFACCVGEWLNRNPARSSPGCCLGCGDGDHGHDPLLPFGLESAGHAWLHLGCWRVWSESRRAEAIAALAAIGIAPPQKWEI